MASGSAKIAYGSFVGEGADVEVKDPGFRPRRVQILAEEGLADGDWTEGMADGSVLKRVTGGTLSLVTGGNGITPLSDGFKIGADADLNGSGELVRWVAYE